MTESLTDRSFRLLSHFVKLIVRQIVWIHRPACPTSYHLVLRAVCRFIQGAGWSSRVIQVELQFREILEGRRRRPDDTS